MPHQPSANDAPRAGLFNVFRGARGVEDDLHESDARSAKPPTAPPAAAPAAPVSSSSASTSSKSTPKGVVRPGPYCIPRTPPSPAGPTVPPQKTSSFAKKKPVAATDLPPYLPRQVLRESSSNDAPPPHSSNDTSADRDPLVENSSVGALGPNLSLPAMREDPSGDAGGDLMAPTHMPSLVSMPDSLTSIPSASASALTRVLGGGGPAPAAADDGDEGRCFSVMSMDGPVSGHDRHSSPTSAAMMIGGGLMRFDRSENQAPARIPSPSTDPLARTNSPVPYKSNKVMPQWKDEDFTPPPPAGVAAAAASPDGALPDDSHSAASAKAPKRSRVAFAEPTSPPAAPPPAATAVAMTGSSSDQRTESSTNVAPPTVSAAPPAAAGAALGGGGDALDMPVGDDFDPCAVAFDGDSGPPD